MPRQSKDQIETWFDKHLHLPTRALYLGDGDDGIDKATAELVIKALHLMDGDAPIRIYLNSIGGSWFDGMAVFDTIKACPAHVEIRVTGCAMSMASIILQAADQRVMTANSVLMLHEGTESLVDALPKSFINWADHAKRAVELMYDIYASRTGRKKSFWKRKCGNADLILPAKEALELGLVDQIV